MSGRIGNMHQGTRGARLLAAAVFLWVLAGPVPGSARAVEGARVLQVRWFSGPEHTRVVVDLSRPCSFDTREVEGPPRLAVNLRKGRFDDRTTVAVGDGLVTGIRRNQGRDHAQVVIDLERESTFNCFSLPAGDGRPDRVVVDIFRPLDMRRPVARSRSGGSAPATAIATPVLAAPPMAAVKPFTVVIDPGHGGSDPGAIRNGIQEKDIVLAVSLEMARLIDSLPGYRAVLTRKGDHYPTLGRRVELASEQDGDLFLSIHCNTNRNTKLTGMEVYFLSLQGATDREARELADKENAANVVGVAPGTDPDDMVMNILMDLRMSQILHESSRLADHLLTAADNSDLVKSRKSKQAGFQVLRSLAMPSALVEISYLSNPSDRRLLQDTGRRRELAEVLVEGVMAWRRDEAALALLGEPLSTGWHERYQVRRGDSLWNLAQRHGTTVGEISRQNNLASREIRVGQILRLPGRGVSQ